jgi:hypothetical protein
MLFFRDALAPLGEAVKVSDETARCPESLTSAGVYSQFALGHGRPSESVHVILDSLLKQETTCRGMKSKQLANVLIKILGLSVVVHSIPGIITGLFTMVRASASRVPPGDYWFYPVSSVALAALGVCLIVKSRCLADFLFKNEDE